jgi:MOSC domain-containing protein YiiM/ferredoxin-NADP reductase
MGSITDLDLPQRIDTVLQIRIGKIKPAFGETSGIFKTPKSKPVRVSFRGCEGDEHAYPPHNSLDNALMQYDSGHYPLWRSEIPDRAHYFEAGAFGENIVSENMSEENVCIGDILRIGDVMAQVTKARPPCYKLNHRFEVKDMSLRTQNKRRTGWYYKVLEEGSIQAGDAIVLIERPHPQWNLVRLQDKLYKEYKDEVAMKELAYMPELGEEIRTMFLNRWTKRIFVDERLRLQGGLGENANLFKWSRYRLTSKHTETPRIASFIFEAIDKVKDAAKVEPGSHIRVKLGADGKLVRAYSVVGGDSNRFELGVAFDDKSRGGSRYLHRTVEVGDILTFSEMKSEFPLETNADCHILIAGGIGITAFIASAQHLQQQNLVFHLYYAVRSTEDKAFGHLLDGFGDHVTVLNGVKGHRLDISKILGNQKPRTHVYVCGPDRLMSAVTTAAKELNFPQSNIHSEAFAAETSGDPFEVELAGNGKVLKVKEEETLLDVLRDAGIDVQSTCEVGNCGTCKVSLCSGRVEHRGTGLSEKEKKSSMLSCVSRGIGRITIDF